MRKFIVSTVPLIVGVIKSRILKWLGHVARMEEDRSSLLIVKSTGKEQLGDRRSVLQWKLEKYVDGRN